MVKIGLLGAGHLGKIHLACLQSINTIEVIGFFDPNEETVKTIHASYPHLHHFDSAFDLINHAEGVIIVTPTVTHFELAAYAIQKGKHVFIEKPLTSTLEEAAQLVQLAQNRNIIIQVGYVERFNPAFLSVQNIPLDPLFIEAHRLSIFNPRGTDVSVVLDLMVHDLDLVLKLVQSPLKLVQASGVAVVSNSTDIANARLEFENGCVANLTASRISMKKMRKLRLFQKDTYISLDLLEKQAQIIQLFDEKNKNKINNGNLLSLQTEEGTKYIHVGQNQTEATNAIKMELEAFINSILQQTIAAVTLEESYRTLQVADEIIKKIDLRKQVLETTKI
jgi:predicted dehydrogenase